MSYPILLINGEEKRQISGTTLAHLQATYPGCFLEHDGVQIRVPEYILQNDEIYELKEVSNANSIVKKDIKVVISDATASKRDNLFKAVGLKSITYKGPSITPSEVFTKFEWNGRVEDAGLPDARNHIENELKKYGVVIGLGGYAVKDVNLSKDLLNFNEEKIGSISGGSDVALVPFNTGSSSIKSCICVLFEIKTNDNVRKRNGNIKHFEPQAHLELLAARCLSDQPEVLVVLTDLVSSAILYTIEYNQEYQGFSAVEQEVNLDQMGAIVAKFLTEKVVANASYRPVESKEDPRETQVIQFKKTKLSHDVGLSWEHFNELKEDTEPNSRERAYLVDQLFRSMEEPQMSSLVYHSMYS